MKGPRAGHGTTPGPGALWINLCSSGHWSGAMPGHLAMHCYYIHRRYANTKSELRKFSGESYSGRYPTSGSRSFVAKYFLVGVRIRNEYPNVAARRRFLLRVFKTRPGVGIAFRDTPATASAPPDPAHDRRSALRINRRTPPKATSTGPSSPGAVALGP